MLIALMQATLLMAVPAKKGVRKVTQPDGTTVSIELHGDEWSHHTTTADGYTVLLNAQGFYVYASLRDGKLAETAITAHDAAQRTAKELQFLKTADKHLQEEPSPMMKATRQKVRARQQQTLAARQAGIYDYKNFRGLVILVEFKDQAFSRSDYKNIITDMVNKENYTGYRDTQGQWQDCTGSVRDYYSDNSNGVFKPDFDIHGPYKINFSKYDAQGSNNAAKLIKAALDKADSEVDFSRYDGDNDGNVDLVYFIFAGNGANFDGNDSRLYWPHRSIIYDPTTYTSVLKDGTYLYDYASSVELYGFTNDPSTITIDGIGTICHEFSHVLGLPDFYDADGKESGGACIEPGDWSLMSNGCYFNMSRTPVGYSLYERYAIGFATPVTIDKEGSYSMENIGTSNTGYRINSQVNNEYFMLENRQPSLFKWDAYLPGSGMLVFRVDRTNNSVWNYNTVNNNPSHPYYELLRADGTAHYYEGYLASVYDTYPGKANVTELHNSSSPTNLLSWNGTATKWGLTNIAEADGVVSFQIDNALEVKSIELPATLTLKEGLTQQLTVSVTPSYAPYTLTWTSSNEKVATVSTEGKVTAVAEGTAVITAKTANGKEARCTVTVTKATTISIAEYKALDDGKAEFIRLDNAEVLYVYGGKAYVRDATGSITLNGVGTKLAKDQIANGYVMAEKATSNNMAQAVIDSNTDISGTLTVSQGSEAKPVATSLSALTTDLYSNLVTVKACTLERNSGIWMNNGNRRVRLFNPFQVSGIKLPSVFAGKYFDVTGIFGTNILNGNIIEEIYLLSSPVEVAEPTGINSVTATDQTAYPIYTLSGQYVGTSLQQLPKGVYVVKGKKVVR